MVVVGAVELDTFGAALSMLSGGCGNGEGRGIVDVEVSTCHVINIFKFRLSLLCPRRTFLLQLSLPQSFGRISVTLIVLVKKKTFWLYVCLYIFLFFLFLFLKGFLSPGHV